MVPTEPPRVSFILPLVAGKKAWAERAAERILAARFHGLPRIEIVAVDDGTSEEIGDYLQSVFAEPIRTQELRVLNRDRTGDLGMLKNEGAAAAQARLLVFLHPDELWQASSLVNAISSAAEFDLQWSFAASPAKPQALEALALERAPLWKGSLIIERAVWERTGGFALGYTGFPVPRRFPGEAVSELLIRALPTIRKYRVLTPNAIEAWNAPGPPPISELLFPTKKLEPYLRGLSVLRASRAIPLKIWGKWAGRWVRGLRDK